MPSAFAARRRFSAHSTLIAAKMDAAGDQTDPEYSLILYIQPRSADACFY